jgi:hypothetical protein
MDGKTSLPYDVLKIEGNPARTRLVKTTIMSTAARPKIFKCKDIKCVREFCFIYLSDLDNIMNHVTGQTFYLIRGAGQLQAGGKLSPPITMCPPGFSDLATVLRSAADIGVLIRCIVLTN